VDSINLHFAGPFSLSSGPGSVFECEFADQPGIYLWTIRQSVDDSHLIHYVGQTSSLANRQKDHLVSALGLLYGIADADLARVGRLEFVWPGLWRDKSKQGPSRLVEAYQTHHDAILNLIGAIDIFFAELHGDQRVRTKVEGRIGWNLRTNHPDAAVLYPTDNRIIGKTPSGEGAIRITADAVIRGLSAVVPL
jgi:hypothetical protein